MSTENAPAAPPPMKLPEVPSAVPLATALERAAAEMPKQSMRGMTRRGKKAVKEETAVEETKAAPVEEPKAKEPEPSKEPVTQERLSAGFAKLERQRKAVQREEARIKEEMARLDSVKAEHEKNAAARMSDLEKRQADIDALAKKFEEDEEGFLEAVAKKHGKTKEEFYDRLTRRRLNGGQPAPEDMIARSNGETEQLKKKLEEIEAKEKAKEEEAAKKTDEEKCRAEYEQAVHAENAGFLEHVKDPGKYPLLSKEADADIIAVARKAAGSNRVSYDEIATYLEELLTFQAWKEDQAGKTAETETPKTVSAPTPKGKTAEAKKPSTITNKMASIQATQRDPVSTHRPSDDRRLEDIIDRTWK